MMRDMMISYLGKIFSELGKIFSHLGRFIGDVTCDLCVGSSRDGNWLLYIDPLGEKKSTTYDCYLWNPNSFQRVILPSLPHPPISFFKCFVSCSSSSSRRHALCYKVYFFYTQFPCFLFCTQDSPAHWKSVYYATGPENMYFHDVVVFKYDQEKTTFCWIAIDGTLFVYMPPSLGVLAAAVKSPNIKIRHQLLVDCKPLDVIALAVDSPNMYGNHERRLVVCSSSSNNRDRLLMVECKPQCSWDVFEFDFYCTSWVRLSKLEGLVLFLGPRYSAVYKHRPGLAGNCICFTEEGDDAYFYVFSLADQSTSIFRNQPHSAGGGFPVSFPNMQQERPLWLRYIYIMFWHAGEFKSIFRYQPYSAKVTRCSPKMQDNLRIPWLSFAKEDAQKNTIGEEPAKDIKARTLDPEESCYAHASFYCDLPDDVLRLVAESLHSAMDYANYRLVCRKLREIARPMRLKSEFSNTPSTECPWLMSFHEDEDGSCTSFLDPSCNMRYFKSNAELSGCKVRCCRNGWILVTHGIRTIFFFEPFSKTKISIPDLPANISFDCISFSSSPTSSDWLIIAIAPRPGIFRLVYLRSGANEWRFEQYQGEEITFLCYGCNQVLHNDNFYYLCQNGRVLAYHPSNSTRPSRIVWTNQNISGSIESLSNYRKGYLVSCKNDLYLVVIGPQGKFVNLYKSDHRKWKEEKVLPCNYSFFISQASSFAVRVNEKAQQNTINLPLLVKNRHVYYKLDTSEFTCDGDNNSSMELHERRICFKYMASAKSN